MSIRRTSSGGSDESGNSLNTVGGLDQGRGLPPRDTATELVVFKARTMADNRTRTAERFLAKTLAQLSEHDHRVVERFINRGLIARNVAHEFEEHLTFGQRLADRFAQAIGSWRFLIVQSSMLAIWIALNITAYAYHWDPYPLILLNLAMSFQAAYAAPILMMSQNRQAEKDHLQARNDYEVNLKAELEIMQLHEKFDSLRDSSWVELVRMQQQQIAMLERLLMTESRIPKP